MVKVCNECGDQLIGENIVTYLNIKKCKTCYSIYQRKAEKRTRREQVYWDTEFGAPLYGPSQVRKNPGEYCDNQQEQYITNILVAMGWSKSDNGIWWKEGIKDKEGKFTCFTSLPKSILGKSKTKFRDYFKKNPNEIPVLKRSSKNLKDPHDKQRVRDVQLQFFLKNKTRYQVAEMFDVELKYVTNILEMTYKSFNRLKKDER